ncbi:MAG: hypothetical protein Q4A07_06345 [Coriobacteriales bacterium]|nr:hypothetical protein [Coriobacteriales bacterium]
MSISDNFGNPQGLVGRLMLAGMNMGHTPMAKWGFAQFEVPKLAIALDISNIRISREKNMFCVNGTATEQGKQ